MAELLASTLYCLFATTMLFRLENSFGPQTIQNQIIMTAFVLGFLAMTLSHAFGITHNAFIFPAVTFGKCLMKRNSFLRCLFYFVFQMAGGIIGVSLDLALHQDRVVPDKLFPILKTSTGAGCVVEGLLSFLFVLVVLSIYSHSEMEDSRKNQGIPTLMFGLAVSASFMIGYPETGGILNSSIVFGLGVVQNHWPHFIWIYWAGPLAGGIVAGIVYWLFLFPPKESECNDSEEESSMLCIQPDISRTKRLDLDRNAASSYVIDANSSAVYRNPVFDGDTEEKDSKV